MEKVLILGVNGFTGRHFLRFAAKRHLADNFSFCGADITSEQKDPGNVLTEFHKTDLTSRDAVSGLLKETKPAYIINLAAVLKGETPEEFLSVNAALPLNILETAKTFSPDIKKILFIGSSAEYGITDINPVQESCPLKPEGMYGLSKTVQALYADFYFRTQACPVNTARAFNIIGPGISPALAIGSFLTKVRDTPDGGELKLGNLAVSRDYLDIEDVCSAYWAVLLRGKPGRTYNICSGKAVKLKYILELIIRESGKRFTIAADPALKTYIPVSSGDNTLLKTDTGWKPEISIEESVRRAYQENR
ncbi:MAG: NAD-dependent epimerase/dehydratase family protein [Elusimicrobiaceae bacterium]